MKAKKKKLIISLLSVLCIFSILFALVCVSGGLFTRSNAAELPQIKFKKVVSGKEHTLAVDDDGYLWGWGDTTYGQLGEISTIAIPSNKPKKIIFDNNNSGLRVKDIAASAYASVLITDASAGNNELYYAGYQAFTLSDDLVPTDQNMNMKKVFSKLNKNAFINPGGSSIAISKFEYITSGTNHFAIKCTYSNNAYVGILFYGEKNGDNAANKCIASSMNADKFALMGVTSNNDIGDTYYISKYLPSDKIPGLSSSMINVYAGYNNTLIAIETESGDEKIRYFMFGENGNNAYWASGDTQSTAAYIDVSNINGNKNFSEKIAVGKNFICMIDDETTKTPDRGTFVYGFYNATGQNGVILESGQTITYKDVAICGGEKQAESEYRVVFKRVTTDSKNEIYIAGTAGFTNFVGSSDLTQQAKIISSTNDDIVFGAGCASIQIVNRTNPRVSILGNVTSENQKKYPDILLNVTDVTPAKTLYTYNFAVGETANAFSTAREIKKSVDNITYDAGEFHTYKIYAMSKEGADGTSQTKTEGNFVYENGEYFTQGKFVENDGMFFPADLTQSALANTRYGNVKISPLAVKNSLGTNIADPTSIFDISVSGDNKSIVVKAKNKTSTIAEEITLEIPYVECISGSTTYDLGNIVSVGTVKFKLRFGNLRPVLKPDSVLFKADANAYKNDGGNVVNIDYSSGSSDYSYSRRAFSPSDFVEDYDSDISQLRFYAEGNIYNSSDSKVSVEFKDGDYTKMYVTGLQTDVEVKLLFWIVDEYAIKNPEEAKSKNECTITASIKGKLNSVNTHPNELKFEDGKQNLIPIEIDIRNIYKDTTNFEFSEVYQYNKENLDVTRIDSNKKFNVVCKKATGSEYQTIIATIRDVSLPTNDPNASIKLTLTVKFDANRAPTKKNGLVTEYTGMNVVHLSAEDLFDDENLEMVSMIVENQPTKGVFTAETSLDMKQLIITPIKNGSDVVIIKVTDGINISTVSFSFTFKGIYIPPIMIGMNEKVVTASYFASFLYDKHDVNPDNVTIEEIKYISGSKLIVENTVAEDKKSITFTPVSKGTVQFEVKFKLDANGNMAIVDLRIESKSVVSNLVAIDAKKLRQEKRDYVSLSITTLLDGLNIQDANSYKYKAVYLTGGEKYVTCEIDPQETTILKVYPLQNTETVKKTKAKNNTGISIADDMQERGSEEVIDQSKCVVEVLIINAAGEILPVTVPFEISGLKVYPTKDQYIWILIIAGAVFVLGLAIPLIANRVAVGKLRNEYKIEIEKNKARERLRQATAKGQAAEIALQNAIDGSIYNPNGTPKRKLTPEQIAEQKRRLAMLQGKKVPPPQQINNKAPQNMQQPFSSMNKPPIENNFKLQNNAQGNNVKPQSNVANAEVKNQQSNQNGMLALEDGALKHTQEFEDMPPLKANENVSQEMRQEIDNKIQAKIAQQNAMVQQQNIANNMHQMQDASKPQSEELQPKLSKAEKKKQEMLQKLKEKYMQGKK